MRSYVRDKRSPTPKSPTVSKVMSANKHKNTTPEITLRRKLWHKGFRGYRLHYKKIPGRPDITFISKKIAIFVNGCYWHRCPICKLTLPKTNTEFWRKKFEANVSRDLAKSAALSKIGWTAITVWECEIANNIDQTVDRLTSALSNN